MWFAFTLPELMFVRSMWKPQCWVTLPALGRVSASHHVSILLSAGQLSASHCAYPQGGGRFADLWGLCFVRNTEF